MEDKPTVEDLELILFGNQYKGRKVLVTGHTGFKGSWLTLWLKEMGAEVSALALEPETSPNHWNLLNLDIVDEYIDIRDADTVADFLTKTQPEIVFHLAAQPLVRKSYIEPQETWSTNVLGTVNVLEACRQTKSVLATVIVTTDKCYENKEWSWGYRETDQLGGHDPYSASKAAAELVSSSYRNSYFNDMNSPMLASARAGNVIGGGDWSEDRLIPDLIRAILSQAPLEIRSPNSTRPWQHVLESLSGYLLLGQKLLEGNREFTEGWNFGPGQEGNISVAEVLTRLNVHWSELKWHLIKEVQPHEANLLYLDSSKAKSRLGWEPVWGIEETITATAEWYKQYYDSGRVMSREQLQRYISAAYNSKVAWAIE